MSDYELRNAKEWDAASSVRLSSSRISEEREDGFTEVQGSRARRQNQAPAAQSTKTHDYAAAAGRQTSFTSRVAAKNGYANARGGHNRVRDGGDGRGRGFSNDPREKSTIHAPQPNRSSTQRKRPQSSAELASQRGEPATGNFSFTVPRRSAHHHLQNKSTGLKAELGAIGRRTATHIVESSADVFSVLIWGDDTQVRQAIQQLEELSSRIQPDKWAKNPAYDGRKENRRELKAHEAEQATRLQLFADSKEYPFEYSFIWPESELSLQQVIDTHDRPRGAFESLRSDCQCSIRCDLANSAIIIQGMQERDVVKAGRTFESIARQTIADMSSFIKISLVGAPTALLHQDFVSMDQKVDLKTTLYHLPGSHGSKKDTFTVSTPKLWSVRPPSDEVSRPRPQKMARRLNRFNRKIILAGLERSLTNMHFVQKAVRMQVNFGELAFLRHFAPRSGSGHHSFDIFRKTMAKDRTDLLLQGMPHDVSITDIVDHLRKHPALKGPDEATATAVETYVVAFDFCRPDGNEVWRHEQEFGESSKKDEMEMRRKSWVRMGHDSDRKSPMILSVLDFEKLDWQLSIHAHQILEPRYMPKEYAEFESGVGVSAASSSAGIAGPTIQRATCPLGHRDLVRIINKPVIQFRLGRTDHILEIAREDFYETHPFQLPSPNPESKWTASFYYSKWINDLGEFAYSKHGEKPSWEPSLSTFFPEEDDSAAQPRKKPRGPSIFLKEIDEVKNILWEATRGFGDSHSEEYAPVSRRMSTIERAEVEDAQSAN